jgi:gas vesicle protein
MTTGVLSLLGGAALGTLAMYLLDPEHGDKRRAAARQVARRAFQTTADAARSAYQRTSQVAGDTWDKVSEKAADASTAAYDALPSGQLFVDTASNAASSAADAAHSWFDSARGYLSRRSPRMERHSDYAMEPAAVSATALSTLLIGASAMWLFDPDRGRARRAWVGQKFTRAMNEIGNFARTTGRHLRNKSKGYYHQTASTVRGAAERVGITSSDPTSTQPGTSAPLM